MEHGQGGFTYVNPNINPEELKVTEDNKCIANMYPDLNLMYQDTDLSQRRYVALMIQNHVYGKCGENVKLKLNSMYGKNNSNMKGSNNMLREKIESLVKENETIEKVIADKKRYIKGYNKDKKDLQDMYTKIGSMLLVTSGSLMNELLTVIDGIEETIKIYEGDIVTLKESIKKNNVKIKRLEKM